MKIFLCIQLLTASSLALPISSENNHEKRSIAASDPANLVEKTEETRSPISTPKTTSDNPPISTTSGNKKITPIGEPLEALPSTDGFKVIVHDLTKSFGGSQLSQIQIGLPADQQETHIIKVSEPYIIRVPHVIVVKEPHIINVGQLDHFESISLPGSIHQFGEFPTIPTITIPSNENPFDISQIYPSNPIEISQGFEGFEGFAPISGVGEIQGFPGFGDISQGFEDLQPQPIPTLEINGDKTDSDSESVTIEAFGKVTKALQERATQNVTDTTIGTKTADKSIEAISNKEETKQ